MRRLPSEQIREHVRFTTQPLEQPRRRSELHAVLESIDGLGDMLMFATDYPHWDFDVPRLAIARLPEEWRERVLRENAQELYRLPEPVASTMQERTIDERA